MSFLSLIAPNTDFKKFGGDLWAVIAVDWYALCAFAQIPVNDGSSTNMSVHAAADCEVVRWKPSLQTGGTPSTSTKWSHRVLHYYCLISTPFGFLFLSFSVQKEVKRKNKKNIDHKSKVNYWIGNGNLKTFKTGKRIVVLLCCCLEQKHPIIYNPWTANLSKWMAKTLLIFVLLPVWRTWKQLSRCKNQWS